MRRVALVMTAAALLAGCGGATKHPATTSSSGSATHAAKAAKAPVRHGPRHTAVPILMYHLVNTPGQPNPRRTGIALRTWLP